MNVKADITQIVLHTDRLVLRSFNENDLQDVFEYASVDGVGQMAGWLPHKDIEQSRKIINMFIANKNTFAIEHNGKVIGSLGLEQYDETELKEFNDKKGIELGFVLSKSYWGQGLMPEAVNRVLQFCFDELKVDFVVATNAVENYQSQRVQEKCGFSRYKLIKLETAFGTVRDTWLSIKFKK